MNTYWTICVDGAASQWHLFALQSKGEVYLSANTKLVGHSKAVKVTTQELAQAFRDAVLPTMRLRHGDAVTLEIATLKEKNGSPDDALVRARVAERLFTPNKKPTSLQT
jgi:hypothetical protein